MGINQDKGNQIIGAYFPFISRIVFATITDVIIMIPIAGLIILLLEVVFYNNHFIIHYSYNYVLHVVIGTVSIVTYSSVLESSRFEGTIGSMLFEIKLEDKKGKRLTFRIALLRNIVKYLLLPLIVVFGISLILLRSLMPIYDYLAGVRVSRRTKEDKNLFKVEATDEDR